LYFSVGDLHYAGFLEWRPAR